MSHHYHPTHVAKLSAQQISKILNGHRVRVKAGNHHVLHLSQEQHKKVQSANKKGCGTTLQFDPYQMGMQEHHKLRGHAHHAHHGGDSELHESSSYHAHHGRGGKGRARGRGPFDIFKSVVKAVAPIAIEKGGDFLKDKIQGWGPTHQPRGRPRKKVGCGGRSRTHKKGGDIGSDILHFAEEAAPIALPLMMGLGEGGHPKRRHHRRHSSHHGEALLPAGY